MKLQFLPAFQFSLLYNEYTYLLNLNCLAYVKIKDCLACYSMPFCHRVSRRLKNFDEVGIVGGGGEFGGKPAAKNPHPPRKFSLTRQSVLEIPMGRGLSLSEEPPNCHTVSPASS